MASSNALAGLAEGLKAVDDVLSYAKPGAGAPSAQERSLFVASVALSYAVWENYIEELAIEAASFLSEKVEPANVPASVREAVMKRQPVPTAWDLTVHPGWRALWLDTVVRRARGSLENAKDYGLLTADVPQVERLFEIVGVNALHSISDHDKARLGELVSLRGQIVHTGKPPDNFYKGDATSARSFVWELAQAVDAEVRSQSVALVGVAPW